MLDLRLTFDITPAFAKTIGDIADALRGKSMPLHDIDPGFSKASRDITDALRGKLSAPGSAEAVEAGNSTLEDESATQAATSCGGVTFQESLGIGALAKAAREELISEIREAVPSLKDEPADVEAQADAPAEPVDVEAQADAPAEPVDVEAQADAPTEPVEAPKPKRGRPRKADAQKDAQTAQESPEVVEADNSTPEPESAPQAATSCESAAARESKAEPVAAPAPAPKPAGDSYGGMPLLQAVQALLDEVAQRGIELADVNARVRAAATERGLPYTSAACLMKSIGYDETRKIVLGE